MIHSFQSTPRILALVFTACLFMTLTAQARAEEGDTDYQLAREIYKQGRWDLAAGRFSKFLQKYPDHRFAATARLSLALALVNQQEYQQAKTELKRFVKDYPNSKNIPDARYRIAECSYLMNNLQTAETEFTTFLKLAPRNELNEWALPYLGDTQLRLGKPTSAIRSFEASLREHPEGRMKNDATYGLARAYDDVGRTDEAIKLYRELASDKSSRLQPQAQLRIGLSLFNQAKYEDAAAAFDQLIEDHPDNQIITIAQLNSAYSYFQVSKHREAISRFQQVGLTGSRGDAASYWSARSHMALGEQAKAIELLNQARKAYPQSKLLEQIEYLFGLALFRTGQAAKALPQLLKVADTWPGGPNADESVHYATECAMLMSRWDDARNLVDRFNKEFPNSPLKEREGVLGYRLQLNDPDSGKRSEAVNQLRRLANSSQDQATKSLASVYLAVALQDQEKHAEVISLLTPLISRQDPGPQKGAAEVLVSSSQLALGNYQKALDQVTVFLTETPDGAQAEQAMSIRIMSNARLGRLEAAEAQLVAMENRFGKTQSYLQARLEVAEQVYGEREWQKAKGLFEAVSNEANSDSIRNRAISGLAWAQYQTGNFDTAQKNFARLLEQDTNPDLIPESSFMRARCLEEGGRITEAMTVYQRTLDNFAPAKPQTSKENLTGAPRRAYEAGKALARLTAESAGPADADSIYEKIVTLFPNAPDRQVIFEQWAFANIEAKDFRRADQIFERLLLEFPEGEHADNARYQLAESELVSRGNIEKAQAAFETLVNNPKVASNVREAAITQLVRIAIELRDWQKTRELTASALESFPDSPYVDEIELHQAETELRLRKLEIARKQIEQIRARLAKTIVEGNPTALRAELLWAELLLAEKNYTALHQYVDGFRKRFPNLDVATEMLDVQGRGWKNSAEFAKARNAFQKVVDHPRLGRLPVGASSQFMIAETWFFEDAPQKALDAYLVVKIKFKNLPIWQQRALFQIGQCDEALENWAKAAENYRELINRYPQSEFAGSARKRLSVVESKLAKTN